MTPIPPSGRAVFVVSASLTAWYTHSNTGRSFENLTSSFAGCTFTSTASGRMSMKSAQDGNFSGGMYDVYACSSAACTVRLLIYLRFMKKFCHVRLALGMSGDDIYPYVRMPPSSVSTFSIFSACSLPYTARMTDDSLPSPGVSSLMTPSDMTLNAISGCDSAIFSTVATTAAASVMSRLRNLRRAGTFANRFSTMTVVPSLAPCSFTSPTLPEFTSIDAPMALSFIFEMILRSETEPIAASASPRKPSVMMLPRSAASFILLVAWRFTASGRSSGRIPDPLSVTLI